MYKLEELEEAMDETERYLNSILQKRMGSVVNTFSANEKSKVTRLIQQEEKIESMPTVFRKKADTTLHFSSKPQQKKEESLASSKQEPEKIEYMAISKRIAAKEYEEHNFATSYVPIQPNSEKELIKNSATQSLVVKETERSKRKRIFD